MQTYSRELLAAHCVATAASVYNCALYGLGEGYVPQDVGKPPYDLAIAVGLPRHVLAAWTLER